LQPGTLLKKIQDVSYNATLGGGHAGAAIVNTGQKAPSPAQPAQNTRHAAAETR
jgi:hypothetical protein